MSPSVNIHVYTSDNNMVQRRRCALLLIACSFLSLTTMLWHLKSPNVNIFILKPETSFGEETPTSTARKKGVLGVVGDDYDHGISLVTAIPYEQRINPLYNQTTFKMMKLTTVYPYHQPILSLATSQQQGKHRVIIHAKLRTGSSFCGEFLNKNPSFFYTFEPLILATKHEQQFNATKWVNKTLSCQFQDVWAMGNQNPIHKNTSLPGWKRKIFCYKSGQSKICGNYTIEQIENQCDDFPATATKTIRIHSLMSMRKLIESGVKVIQLVRDPRATISSIISMYAGQKTKEDLKVNKKWYSGIVNSYCRDILADIKAAQRMFHTGSLSYKVPYILVRYEDLVLQPKVELQRIYDMLQMKAPKEVHSWIDSFQAANQGNGKKPKVTMQETFNTIRLDSTSSIDKWRHEVPWSLISDVQDLCPEFMETLGYKMVNDSKELTGEDNDTVIRLNFTHLTCMYTNCESNNTRSDKRLN